MGTSVCDAFGSRSVAMSDTLGSSTCKGGDGWRDSISFAMDVESIIEVPSGSVTAGMVKSAKPPGAFGGTRALSVGSTSGYSTHCVRYGNPL
jgi:hypothetical protein